MLSFKFLPFIDFFQNQINQYQGNVFHNDNFIKLYNKHSGTNHPYYIN